MPEKSIVFFIRHEIDLDHSTPIFSKVRGDKGIPVVGLIFHPTKSFQSDWRVRHLKALGVDIFHVVDLIGISKLVRSILLYGPLAHRGGVVSRIWKIAHNRLIWPVLLSYAQRRIDRLDLQALLRRIAVPDNVGLLVFDNHVSRACINFSSQARSIGIPTVAIPHGGGFTDGLSKSAHTEIFDFVLAPDRILLPEVTDSERRLLIGEPRYDENWVKRLDSIAPRFIDPPNLAGSLRVVIMVGKTKYGEFDEKGLSKVLDVLSSTTGIHTVVKTHPRDREFDETERAGVTIADKNISSDSLVRWADLLLFTDTSIVLDAIVLDKPVAYLKFLVNVRPFHESALNMSWDVRSMTDLTRLIENFKIDSSSRTYTTKEREECLSLFVRPVEHDVLGGFSREFVSIMKHKVLSHTRKGSGDS